MFIAAFSVIALVCFCHANRKVFILNGLSSLQHWNGNMILMKFSSLAALKVVSLITFCAASDEDFVKMTMFWFQWGVGSFQSDSLLSFKWTKYCHKNEVWTLVFHGAYIDEFHHILYLNYQKSFLAKLSAMNVCVSLKKICAPLLSSRSEDKWVNLLNACPICTDP